MVNSGCRGKNCCGLGRDRYGGMAPIGNIIKDARLFGVLRETETC